MRKYSLNRACGREVRVSLTSLKRSSLEPVRRAEDSIGNVCGLSKLDEHWRDISVFVLILEERAPYLNVRRGLVLGL